MLHNAPTLQPSHFRANTKKWTKRRSNLKIWKPTVLCWESASRAHGSFLQRWPLSRVAGEGGGPVGGLRPYGFASPPFIDSQIFTLVLNSQPTMSRNTAAPSFTARQLTFLATGARKLWQYWQKSRSWSALHVEQEKKLMRRGRWMETRKNLRENWPFGGRGITFVDNFVVVSRRDDILMWISIRHVFNSMAAKTQGDQVYLPWSWKRLHEQYNIHWISTKELVYPFPYDCWSWAMSYYMAKIEAKQSANVSRIMIHKSVKPILEDPRLRQFYPGLWQFMQTPRP